MEKPRDRIRRDLTVAVATLMLLVSAAGPALAQGGSIGIVDTGTGEWFLRDPSNGATTKFFYGNPGDLPMVGDWDCDGDETPGLYRQSDGFVYLRNSNSQGMADLRFFFGNPGDIPLAGDFNGDGCDSVSIYRPSEGRVFVIDALGADDGGLGNSDSSYYFGNPGDKPYVGDFDNDGIDEVGLHRESTGLVYFRFTHTQGIADSEFIFGDPGDKMVAAEWANRGAPGPESVGLFRPSNSTFYLRYTNTQGVADETLGYGLRTGLPVAGDFGALAGGGSPPGGGPPAGCPPDLPADAVSISPGQSIQSAVDANPVGTVFAIRAGVHRRQTVSAKDHQHFVGEPGAILDGDNVAEFAFQGGGRGVIIECLVIRRYANPLQTGVLRTSAGATDWIVRSNEITENKGAAVYANHGWRVSDNGLHHNGQVGIFAGGRDIIIEGNEIAFNNTDGHNPYVAAGGSKFLRTTNLIVRGNYVHHNHGPGLWTDTDNIGTVYENNLVRDNFGPGIFHEASFDAVIRNNLIEGNGFGYTAWLDGAGILLNTSKNVRIIGNTVRNNNDGIGVTHVDRGTSATYGIHEARNILVENNTIVMSAGQTGIVTNLTSNDVFSTAWQNRFVGNTYVNNTGSATAWAWARQNMTWGQWQAAGQQ